MTTRRCSPKGRHPLALAALGIYAVLLAASPLLHHDLACHLQSKTHCTACSSSPSAGRTEGEVSLATRTLPEAGRIEWVACPALDAGTILETTGRSPPA